MICADPQAPVGERHVAKSIKPVRWVMVRLVRATCGTPCPRTDMRRGGGIYDEGRS